MWKFTLGFHEPMKRLLIELQSLKSLQTEDDTLMFSLQLSAKLDFYTYSTFLCIHFSNCFVSR